MCTTWESPDAYKWISQLTLTHNVWIYTTGTFWWLAFQWITTEQKTFSVSIFWNNNVGDSGGINCLQLQCCVVWGGAAVAVELHCSVWLSNELWLHYYQVIKINNHSSHYSLHTSYFDNIFLHFKHGYYG